ncbi:MAG: hypothetical protein JRJ60_17815 [Deltaproteobacteria bacterium]|nr:hypothetical protein [Deltaproteobacteria bacterium]
MTAKDLPCSPKTGPLDMLESPELEKEDSDERHTVQSGEDHWHKYDRCRVEVLQITIRTGKVCCLITPSIFETAAFTARLRTALMKCGAHSFLNFILKTMQAGTSAQASFGHDPVCGNTHDEKQGKQDTECSSI